jgi:hypothetical protein
MARAPKIIAGIAWFRRDQWSLLRSLAADPDKLEQSHSEWIRHAEKAIKTLKKQGVSARKVDVEVNALQRWCAEQGRPLDGAARAAYAAAHLRDEHEHG